LFWALESTHDRGVRGWGKETANRLTGGLHAGEEMEGHGESGSAGWVASKIKKSKTFSFVQN
jgi:hypothetical protein